MQVESKEGKNLDSHAILFMETQYLSNAHE